MSTIYTKYFLLNLFFIYLISGCSNEPKVDIPEHIRELDNLSIISFEPELVPSIDLVNDVRYGDTNDVIIGQIELQTVFEPNRATDRIAVDDVGRVYIGDFQQNTIHVFEPDGTWLTNLGREGSGPGELRGILHVEAKSGYLFVIDNSLLNINAYSLETLTYSHTIDLAVNTAQIEELTGKFPDYYFIRSDESVLIGFFTPPFLVEDSLNPDPILFYVMDQEGTLQPEQILKQNGLMYHTGHLNGRQFMHTFEFTPVSLMSLSYDDYIYTSWTEDFLIKMFSPDGDYLRAFYYPFEKMQIDRTGMIENTPQDHIKDLLRQIDLPDSWPVIKTLFVDDKKRMWVSTFGDNEEKDDWWVIGETGDVLGHFALPKQQWIREIKNDRIYILNNDFEAEDVSVISYRMEF